MLIKYDICCKLIEDLHGSPPSNVLHIGAHTGEEAQIYSDYGVKDIVWFEANPDLFGKLQSHLSGIAANSLIITAALYDENTRLKFNITNNIQSSSLYELGTHSQYYPGIVITEEREIEVYRFDWLAENMDSLKVRDNINFLNIDTQGAEFPILVGMGKHLESPHLNGIYLEVNKEPLYKDIVLVDEIDKFLDKRNFTRILTKWTQQGWGDALYLKRVELHA